MIGVVSLDAIAPRYMSWEWKIGLSLFYSAWLAFFAMYWLFGVEEYRWSIPIIGGDASLTTLMSNFVAVQGVFPFVHGQ